MRYLVAPTFAEKLRDLFGDSQTLAQVSNLLHRVEDADKDEMLSRGKLEHITGDIYVLRTGGLRIFCSVGTNDDGEYLLLLDVAERAQSSVHSRFRSTKNPRINVRYNPRVNSSINPRVNSSLNPRVNSSLNPRVNSALNPRVNSALNPRVNSAINYRVNSSLNPRVNSALNPRVNSSVNPRINRGFGGPFLYDIDLNQQGFIVWANDSVILTFDASLDFTGIGVKNAVGGYTLFDVNNDWIGQLLPDGQEGFLRFNSENEWSGIMV